MKPAIPDLGGPRVRTVLDLGAGAGGLLAVLQHRYGMQGVGVTMDGPNSPYLETMAARGVIGLRASLSDRLPFQDGAFDLIHSRLSGLRFAESEGTGDRAASGGRRQLRASGTARRAAKAARARPPERGLHRARLCGARSGTARLVRPGGYLMQTAWKIGRGPQHSNRTATRSLGLANRLGWKQRCSSRRPTTNASPSLDRNSCIRNRLKRRVSRERRGRVRRARAPHRFSRGPHFPLNPLASFDRHNNVIYS